MQLKQGVSIQGIRPELLIAIMIAARVFQVRNCILTLTSVTDGKHSATSLHYTGCAFDCRTRNLDAKQKKQITSDLKVSLTADFDVVLEATHIHIEYQPRYHG